MHDKEQFQGPIEPIEALMSIRAIVDATRDDERAMPGDVAIRLIDIILDKALPSFRARDITPPDDDATPQ